MLVNLDHISSWKTGSHYICDPPVVGTDVDTVVLVEDLSKARKSLTEQGWTISGADEYKEDPDAKEEDWFSAKKTIEEVVHNYIVMNQLERFQRWVTATELSKFLNLREKKDRIKVFQVIVDGATLY